jgi:hypothetical protein
MLRCLRDNQSGNIWGIGHTDAEALTDALAGCAEVEKTEIVRESSQKFRQSGACQTVMAYMDIDETDALRYGYTT